MVGGVNLLHLHLRVNIAVIQEVDISYLHLQRHTKPYLLMYFYLNRVVIEALAFDVQLYLHMPSTEHECSKMCCIH